MSIFLSLHRGRSLLRNCHASIKSLLRVGMTLGEGLQATSVGCSSLKTNSGDEYSLVGGVRCHILLEILDESNS